LEEVVEEGLFRADAVNPERDRYPGVEDLLEEKVLLTAYKK